MVHAVRLTATGADLNIVWETCLQLLAYGLHCTTMIAVVETHPHRRVQRPRDLVVLLKSGTASQDLRQPELTDCTLHVPDLSLWWRRCLGPL
jgi:hypothetical protein